MLVCEIDRPVMLFLLLVTTLSPCLGVMFPDRDQTGTCLREGGPVMPCVVSGAVSWLEEARDKQLQVGEGLLLAPEAALEEELSLEGDPREASTLVEAVSRALSTRRLLWQMDWLYPGLMMVVGRNPEAKLFFTIDRSKSSPELDMSTGRLMVKRTLVPMLLGVQVKAASLLPLLMAALFILTKKSFLLSQLSLLLAGYQWFQSQQHHRPLQHFHSGDWQRNPSPSFI